jgi:hypothetical protein
MPDAASMHLIVAMIAKNRRMLDGRVPPPRGVSLFTIYKETAGLRALLAEHEARLMAERRAKRARLPFPSDLKVHA